MTSVKLKAPGRICLFGDKIDIAFKPVIAACIDMFLHVEAKPREDRQANAVRLLTFPPRCATVRRSWHTNSRHPNG